MLLLQGNISLCLWRVARDDDYSLCLGVGEGAHPGLDVRLRGGPVGSLGEHCLRLPFPTRFA